MPRFELTPDLLAELNEAGAVVDDGPADYENLVKFKLGRELSPNDYEITIGKSPGNLIIRLKPQSIQDEVSKACAEIPGINNFYDDKYIGSKDAVYTLLVQLGVNSKHFKNTVLDPDRVSISHDEWLEEAKNWRSVYDDCLDPVQAVGVAWLCGHMVEGCIENDDTGVGKTIQTIVAACIRARDVPKIIIVKAGHKARWKEEIEAWALPELVDSFYVFEMTDERALNHAFAVVEHHYPKALSRFGRSGFNKMPLFVAIDEVHEIRNESSAWLWRIATITGIARYVVGLSATILCNEPAQLYNLVSLVRPAFYVEKRNVVTKGSIKLSNASFGPRTKFRVRYCGAKFSEELNILKDGEDKLLTNGDELAARLRFIKIRRKLSDTDAPEAVKLGMIYEPRELKPELTEAARKKIEVYEKAGLHVTETNDVHAMLEFTKVAQIDPKEVDDGKSHVFFLTRKSAYRFLSYVLKSYFVWKGINVYDITGEVPPGVRAQREREMRVAVERGQCVIAVASMGASSTGINLEFMDTMHIIGIPVNPEEAQQVSGRLVRFNRTKPRPTCIVWYMNCGTEARRLEQIARKFENMTHVQGESSQNAKSMEEALAFVAAKSEQSVFASLLSDTRIAELTTSYIGNYTTLLEGDDDDEE